VTLDDVLKEAVIRYGADFGTLLEVSQVWLNGEPAAPATASNLTTKLWCCHRFREDEARPLLGVVRARAAERPELRRDTQSHPWVNRDSSRSRFVRTYRLSHVKTSERIDEAHGFTQSGCFTVEYPQGGLGSEISRGEPRSPRGNDDAHESFDLCAKGTFDDATPSLTIFSSTTSNPASASRAAVVAPPNRHEFRPPQNRDDQDLGREFHSIERRDCDLM